VPIRKAPARGPFALRVTASFPLRLSSSTSKKGRTFMFQASLRPGSSQVPVRTADLQRLAKGWLLDCECRRLSQATLEARRGAVEKFLEWLKQEEHLLCSPLEIKSFMLSLRTAHESEEGRFGNPRLRKPRCAMSIKDCHVNLSTLFRFLNAEGFIEGNPMEGLRPPVHRADQVQPFTEEQVQALLRAARKSHHPKRDEALVLCLLGTGVRTSELCSLKLEDVCIVNRKAVVLEKGNKRRSSFFGRETGRVPDLVRPAPTYRAAREGSGRPGSPQLCHTFRHACAVMFLRAGGSVFAVEEGVGSAEDIDRVMKLGMNHPMGATGDGGLHRPGRAPGDPGSPPPGVRRPEIPPLPSAAEARGSGLAGAQDRPGLLRVFVVILSRDESGSYGAIPEREKGRASASLLNPRWLFPSPPGPDPPVPDVGTGSTQREKDSVF
jgi:site-specific recombinase XerD